MPQLWRNYDVATSYKNVFDDNNAHLKTTPYFEVNAIKKGTAI